MSAYSNRQTLKEALAKYAPVIIPGAVLAGVAFNLNRWFEWNNAIMLFLFFFPVAFALVSMRLTKNIAFSAVCYLLLLLAFGQLAKLDAFVPKEFSFASDTTFRLGERSIFFFFTISKLPLNAVLLVGILLASGICLAGSLIYWKTNAIQHVVRRRLLRVAIAGVFLLVTFSQMQLFFLTPWGISRLQTIRATSEKEEAAWARLSAVKTKIEKATIVSKESNKTTELQLTYLTLRIDGRTRHFFSRFNSEETDSLKPGDVVSVAYRGGFIEYCSPFEKKEKTLDGRIVGISSPEQNLPDYKVATVETGPNNKRQNFYIKTQARNDELLDREATVRFRSTLDAQFSFGRPIAGSPDNQMNPAIYKNFIVWAENARIYLFDLSTKKERQISNVSGNSETPAIFGDKIVWEGRSEYGSMASEIYLYDLTTGKERRLTSSPGVKCFPAIYGDKVVWQDGRNGNFDIYLYDLLNNTERQITMDTKDQFFPSIYKDKIVWMDRRNDTIDHPTLQGDIYLFDLASNEERPICTDPYGQWNPKIYGDTIVWDDYRNVYNSDGVGDGDGFMNRDIYAFDLSTNKERQVTPNMRLQGSPSIYGNTIVWSDRRNGENDIYAGCNGDIFAYNLMTNEERWVTAGPGERSNPAIYGDTVVWEDADIPKTSDGSTSMGTPNIFFTHLP